MEMKFLAAIQIANILQHVVMALPELLRHLPAAAECFAVSFVKAVFRVEDEFAHAITSF